MQVACVTGTLESLLLTSFTHFIGELLAFKAIPPSFDQQLSAPSHVSQVFVSKVAYATHI